MSIDWIPCGKPYRLLVSFSKGLTTGRKTLVLGDLATIDLDNGTITFKPDCTLEDMTRLFWEVLAMQNPEIPKPPEPDAPNAVRGIWFDPPQETRFVRCQGSAVPDQAVSPREMTPGPEPRCTDDFDDEIFDARELVEVRSDLGVKPTP